LKNTPHKYLKELRSDAVQDIIRYKPYWLVRWGTALFSCFFLLLFLLTFFVKYPDIIKSPFSLTATDAPKAIVSKATGKITKLFVQENMVIQKDKPLAYIEAIGKHDEILALSEQLGQAEQEVNNGNYQNLASLQNYTASNLGEIQPEFQRFEQTLTRLQSLTSTGFYGNKKKILRQEYDNLHNLESRLKEQINIYSRDYVLAKRNYEAHQRLAKQGVISSIELARQESQLISKQLPYKQAESALINNRAEQSAKNKELLDLDKNLFEEKNFTLEALKTLISAVDAWKNKYIITSPVEGRVFFQSTLQENQVVAENQELFFLGSNRPAEYIGEMAVAQDNLGKIKTGKMVIIKFNSYPSEEYGMVEGFVSSISEIPNKDNSYLVKVKLKNGLKTTYNKTLRFRNGMIASADIIVEDQTLAEKILYQFRRAVQR
jgi:multidrug resistance efflux pump